MPGGFLPPPAVIQSWPTPNYTDPVTRGYSLVACLAIFLFLALLALAARIWARFVLLRSPGLDDWLAICAAIPTVGHTVVVILASEKYNFDRHIWDVRPEVLAPMSKNSWIAQLFFVISTCLIKLSILLFNRRIAAGTHSRLFSAVVWGAIGAIIAYAIAFMIVLFVQCQPLNSYWLRFSPTYTGKYHCPSKEAISLPISAYLSVATDFLALLLPFWLVWNIKLPKRQKWSLYAIFALGLIVIMAGIFRSVYLYQMFHTTYDVTWVGYKEWIWTAVENDLALIAASAPALRPIFRRYYPSDSNANDNHHRHHPRPRNSPYHHRSSDSYTTRPARKGYYTGTRNSSTHVHIIDVEEGLKPVLPIQTRQEQELATIESRIKSLINASTVHERDGTVWEPGEGSHWDDSKSGTLWNSEAGSEGTPARDDGWPLPGKSV